MWARATDEAWALHRAHVRAGRCIVLHGPHPKEFVPPVAWPELEEALRHELQYVSDHLGDHPDHCVLNLCRLIYSFMTRDVVTSKMAAADWVGERFPRWRPAIELAQRIYPGRAGRADRELLLSAAQAFNEFAGERIDEAITRPPRDRTRPLDTAPGK